MFYWDEIVPTMEKEAQESTMWEPILNGFLVYIVLLFYIQLVLQE